MSLVDTLKLSYCSALLAFILGSLFALGLWLCSTLGMS